MPEEDAPYSLKRRSTPELNQLQRVNNAFQKVGYAALFMDALVVEVCVKSSNAPVLAGSIAFAVFEIPALVGMHFRRRSIDNEIIRRQQ